jgi:hypothetical protein
VVNTDLRKAGVYDLGDQKQVTAWLDLRHKAARGRYDEYNARQVAYLLEGVRQFVTRVRP